jgi:hypothetical protein
MPIQVRLLFGNLLAVLCCATSSLGQSTEPEIKARLKDKPLYLRGCWRDTHLSFDADGKLVGQSLPVSFTLSGFEFRSAHLKKDKLQVEGTRIGVEFIKEKPQRVSLGRTIKVDIALPANGDFAPALDAIFADGLAELAPVMPPYWQRWAKSKLSPPEPGDAAKAKTPAPVSVSQHNPPTGEAAPGRVGGSVQAPRLNAHREAEFDEAARHLKYSGVTLIGLIVEENGMPTHLNVIRPLGVGLDEQALAAVQSYRFSPAVQDGSPVTDPAMKY